MPEVKAVNVGKQLKVPQPKTMPFAAIGLPRNECMITVSGGGKTNAHIRTLTDPDKLGGLFDKYIVMSPNAYVDPQYRVLAKYIERTMERHVFHNGFRDFQGSGHLFEVHRRRFFRTPYEHGS